MSKQLHDAVLRTGNWKESVEMLVLRSFELMHRQGSKSISRNSVAT